MDLKAHPAIEIQIWINKIITITNVVQFCIGPPAFGLFSVRFLTIQGSKICACIKWNRWIHESGWRIFFHTNKRDTWVQPENNQKLLREYIRCNDFFHKALFSGSAQKQPFLLFKKQLGIDQWTNRRMDATSYRNAYHCPRRFKQFIRFPSG